MVPNKETLRIKYTHDKAETQPTPAVRWCAGRGFVFRVRHNWCVVLGKSFICDSVSPPVTVISQHCRVDYERYTKSALNASWRKRELELSLQEEVAWFSGVGVRGRLFYVLVTIPHLPPPRAPPAPQPGHPTPDGTHSITPPGSRDAASPPPTPLTPALQRLGHEVLPGFPLPAEEQHQPRAASHRGHGDPSLGDP